MNRVETRIILIALFVFGLSHAAAAAEHGLGDIPLDPGEYQQYLKILPFAAPPASYDARDDGIVTTAKDQGFCGSCWAFASVGAFESHLLKEFGVGPTDLSEQEQVSCNTGMSGCCGGSMTAIQWWETQGPIEESCFPYGESSTICPPTYRTVACSGASSCTRLIYCVTNFHTVSAGSTTQVKTSLYNDGPSYFRFDVYDDFSGFWHSGDPGDVYVNDPGTEKRGGHAVLIIGWSDAKGAYLLKNSWGAADGPNNDGTFWMAYSGHAHDLGFGMANFDLEVYELPEWEEVYDQIFSDIDSAGSLPLLRAYRDEVLMSDPKGRALVNELYEEHSLELAKILLTHPRLMRRGKLIIEDVLPGIKKMLDGGTMVITPLQIAVVNRFLDDIARLGSPAIKAYISSVQEALRGDLTSLSVKSNVSENRRAAPGLKKGNLAATWGTIKRNVQEGQ